MSKKEVIIRQIKSGWSKSLRQEIKEDESELSQKVKKMAFISRWIEMILMILLFYVIIFIETIQFNLGAQIIMVICFSLLVEPLITIILSMIFVKG